MADQATRFQRRDNFLVFGAPALHQDEYDEVLSTMRSGWLGTGPRTARFQQAFAKYKKVPHAAAVNSGTAALHLALLGAGIGPGDEVITTALTFCATVNAIIQTGATPVLADVDPHSMNLSSTAAAAKITDKTKALLPVHLAGRPCDMDPLMALAEAHDLAVIEDAAHAIEAVYHGRGAGTIGDFGCFSFYVTKNLTTGEGGMLLARERSDIERARTMALHGLSADAWARFGDQGYRHYQVEGPGFKYNMPDLCAAIGMHQLQRIEQNWLARQSIWYRYNENLAGLPLTLPPAPAPATRHAHHLYTVLIDPARTGISRDAFLDAMTAHRIGVGVHYLAIPEHPYYQRRFGWHPAMTPEATRIGRQTLSLPLSPGMSDGDVGDVIAAVYDILGR